MKNSKKSSAPSPADAKPRAAVFCSGNGSNLEALLLNEKAGLLEVRIELVVCDKPAAYALVRANRHEKKILLLESKGFKSREEYDAAVLEVLRKEGIEWVILAGFMRILSPVLVKAYRGRMVNIHPSLLPAFKGIDAIGQAWRAGVKQTGVSVHWVTEDLDSGAVILSEEVPLKPGETLESLEQRIHEVEHRIYSQAINRAVRDSKSSGNPATI